jgi:plasmid stability protein
MSQVIVRNLDQQTVSALKSRAAAHGRSLEQELRLVLATAAKPSRQEVLEIADAIRSLGTKPVSSDLDALIREERDPSMSGLEAGKP